MRDPKKVDELWSRRLRIWFPDGKKDPELALIRVRIDRAEVWDSKSATMIHLEGLGAVLAQRRTGRAEDRPPARRPSGPRARKADPARAQRQRG